MASIQERRGSFRVIFRHEGRQFFVALGRIERREAEAKAAQVDYLLLRIKQGLVAVPPGVDLGEFLMSDGRMESPRDAAPLTLDSLRSKYLDTHRDSLEPRTVEGVELHFKHLLRELGPGFVVRSLALADLQGYVTARSKAKGSGGRRLAAATIRKELVSLRTAWNWAARSDLVAGRFPNDGLRFPKTEEKPPFQTRGQIERQIAGGGLSKRQVGDLWDSLYLETDELAEMLEVIRDASRYPWVHPMACTAAYAGARRSELIRMRTADVDFAAGVVTVREKKRVRGRSTTRRVPMAPALESVLKAYLESHPGGSTLFVHGGDVDRSKKRRTGYAPPTVHEVQHHFRHAISRSRWSVVKGLHSLRHSFISACASRGVDQRMLQEWAGHMTAEMQRRYAHLYPSVQRDVMRSVFGPGPAAGPPAGT